MLNWQCDSDILSRSFSHTNSDLRSFITLANANLRNCCAGTVVNGIAWQIAEAGNVAVQEVDGEAKLKKL